MRPLTIKVLALWVALALSSIACGRKGDPGPRKSPKNIPPASAASLSSGAFLGPQERDRDLRADLAHG